jgi:hypothetical protein
LSLESEDSHFDFTNTAIEHQNLDLIAFLSHAVLSVESPNPFALPSKATFASASARVIREREKARQIRTITKRIAPDRFPAIAGNTDLKA